MAPVIYLASSDISQAAIFEIDSGSIKPKGCCELTTFNILGISSMVRSYIGVLTIDGAIAFILILLGTNSTAAVFTNELTAALEAAYVAVPLAAQRDAVEDIATIDAPSLTYLLLLAMQHMSAKTPKFTLSISSVCIQLFTRSGQFRVMPAQCTIPSNITPSDLQESNTNLIAFISLRSN